MAHLLHRLSWARICGTERYELLANDGYSDTIVMEELTNQLVHLVTIAGWDDMKR